jgi:hypothetical protein
MSARSDFEDMVALAALRALPQALSLPTDIEQLNALTALYDVLITVMLQSLPQIVIDEIIRLNRGGLGSVAIAAQLDLTPGSANAGSAIVAKILRGERPGAKP